MAFCQNEEGHSRLSQRAKARFGRREASYNSAQGVFAEAKPHQKRFYLFFALRGEKSEGVPPLNSPLAGVCETTVLAAYFGIEKKRVLC
jgi:hypothetical protein